VGEDRGDDERRDPALARDHLRERERDREAEGR
jgi:hypothetical protein